MTLQEIDLKRKTVSNTIDPTKKASLGQFFTPIHIAKFMASLFERKVENVKLLDPGAGVGSLSTAFVTESLNNSLSIKSISITCYEVDPSLLDPLSTTLQSIKKLAESKHIDFSKKLQNEDFILSLSKTKDKHTFTHAIINPPYKKIATDSNHRIALRKVGIEVVNLYAGFVAAALYMLEKGGELVAIIPRSFCNGSYYLPFRKYILENAIIKKIHLFDSRTEAFNEEDVLQENVIIHLVKGAKKTDVIISRSTDTSFADHSEAVLPFDRIVKSDDENLYFHIPENSKSEIETLEGIRYTLKDLSLDISTGPVVDFRMGGHLKEKVEKGCVPLIYSNHFGKKEIIHPVQSKKPNGIVNNSVTSRWLSPLGFYTVTKRFSSKEEKQRIVARVLNPESFNSQYLGLENHLNYFHQKKMPLEKSLAYGLAAYLNSSIVDNYFRLFSGHTQVNATDLKQLLYPDLKTILKLGEWAIKQPDFNPAKIDTKLRTMLRSN